MSATCRRLLLSLLAHALWAFGADAAELITVPGTSNPWLAGMPPETIANQFDLAPDQSPVGVRSIRIVPGSELRFNATGAVKKGPSWPFAGPDGDIREIAGTVLGSENGLSDVVAPKNALLGVFLDSETPGLTTEPEPLIFGSSASRDYLTITPELRQVFFIGDGHTSSGVAQRVLVPAGATRLFLGTMDGIGWYNNEGSFTVEVLSEVPVTPPAVSIIHPSDFAVFIPGSDIQIDAAASDLDGTVERVEFFAGSRSLGLAVSSPYNFIWRDVPVGDYVLTARASDNSGLSTISKAVRVVVSDLAGDVAVVRAADDSEIEQMQAFLLEMGLSSQLFDPTEITFEALARYKLIIWHDLGMPFADLNASNLAALSRSFSNNIPLYFIGEGIATFATNLNASIRGTWENLARLRPATSANTANPGPITWIETGSQNPITQGRFGSVAPFPHPGAIGGAAVVDTQAQVFGMAGESPVLVGFPDLDEVDLGGPRSLTQTFPVFHGGDATSQHERKELFQNIVCWLIRCFTCSAVDLNLQTSSPEGPVRVGEPAELTLIVRHGGECEATGVIVTNSLPASVRFVSAETEQGSWRHENGTVVFHLGHLGKASVTELKLRFVPTTPGTSTNVASVRLNGLEATTENNTTETAILVHAGTAPILGIVPVVGGNYRVSIQGTSNHRFKLEASTDLREWTMLTNAPVGTATTSFLEPFEAGFRYRFFRLKSENPTP